MQFTDREKYSLQNRQIRHQGGHHCPNTTQKFGKNLENFVSNLWWQKLGDGRIQFAKQTNAILGWPPLSEHNSKVWKKFGELCLQSMIGSNSIPLENRNTIYRHREMLFSNTEKYHQQNMQIFLYAATLLHCLL